MPAGTRREFPSGSTSRTSDIGFAAFLFMNDLRVLAARRIPGSKQFEFVFEDPEARACDLQVAYVNSEARKFDEAVRAMKKMCQDHR